ncbi:MAG: hypothetical protein GXO63_01865 [Candidatus Micrarchaeota archaeon]|nr:hypothetical protein [Candidatus Micrarchaeota archaeon]
MKKIRKARDFLGRAEKFVEDFILVLLSLFLLVLSISALAVLSAEVPSVDGEKVCLENSGFLTKAEYFAGLVAPWVGMIIGLLVARELWLIRRTLRGAK